MEDQNILQTTPAGTQSERYSVLKLRWTNSATTWAGWLLSENGMDKQFRYASWVGIRAKRIGPFRTPEITVGWLLHNLP